MCDESRCSGRIGAHTHAHGLYRGVSPDHFGDGFRLYIVIEGSGVKVALAGDVRLDPATGQITTVFDNLPQVPFSSFALTFQGGSHAVLANPVISRADRSGAEHPWTVSAAEWSSETRKHR